MHLPKADLATGRNTLLSMIYDELMKPGGFRMHLLSSNVLLAPSVFEEREFETIGSY